ncbi:hypothetical protein [Blastomonas aquatica]|uniref:Uncharacterized protein n=1 Tax=Blastomonas aquatica TaxID=1510276 RepID=A0ABQ1JLY2_9SPHN|nr:hypothetical protein [Blastomonas aquatica]GGB71830.1 hypothetical protein GCM10010833_28780 [Blastomonas aquatica]
MEVIRNVIIKHQLRQFDDTGPRRVLTRRTILKSLIAAPLMMAPGIALGAIDTAGDVKKLKAFVAQTIGRAPAERKEISRKTINAINPLKGDNKLLELAALGVLARESSTSEALKDDLPGRSKRLITAVLVDQSEAGWSHALAGAWHFEVSRRSRAGALVLGADRSEGEKRFSAARAKTPGDMGIVLLEAIALIYDGADNHSQRITHLLAKASAKAPKGAGKYELAVARYAAKLSEIAATRQFAKLETAVRAIY